ncbi:PHP domain-containing protein [bacterium]|nr:PHP domain-containing protein [bacterium]
MHSIRRPLRPFARIIQTLVGAFLFTDVSAAPVWADAMARMTAPKLQEVRESIEKHKQSREAVSLKTPFEETKAILHCHSKWSHDSRSTIEEILKGAHANGVRVIMFTEHPADHYDFIVDGHQGIREGVLLIPGAELKGMLAYPLKSIKGMDFSSPQEQSDMIKRTGGLAFYCHLEERMDWQVAGIAGTEIYNVHADAKEESRLFLGLVNPLFWLQLRPLVDKYPQEVFSALQDYPKDYLRRYDELCQMFPHTGVAGNDSHHNIGIRIIRGEKDLILLEDIIGQKVAELSIGKLPFLAALAGKSKTGDVILQVDLDPYERAFQHVTTHLLLDEFSREGVWRALEAGRAFVGFDWITDTTGYVFQAETDKPIGVVGSKLPFTAGMKLRSFAPLEAKHRLIRNGQVFGEKTGRDVSFEIAEPGVYRAEVWVQVADEERIWILTNPIYIKGDDTQP